MFKALKQMHKPSFGTLCKDTALVIVLAAMSTGVFCGFDMIFSELMKLIV